MSYTAFRPDAAHFVEQGPGAHLSVRTRLPEFVRKLLYSKLHLRSSVLILCFPINKGRLLSPPD